MPLRSRRRWRWLLSVLVVTVYAGTGRPVRAQEVAELQRHYSGKTLWDAGAGILRFESSGRVGFPGPEVGSTIWNVPADVRKIVLGDGVRVEAAFTVRASLDIEGAGPASSEIYGTRQAALLHGLGVDHDGGCMPYSAVYGNGSGTVVNVRNLTSRDPIGFHFVGRGGAVFHLEHVAALDDRGGFYNHSDGIQAGKGTTVADSFFSTGDDVIKVYADMTVTDTTIEMIRNAVPIQLGWDSYGDGARGVFRNLKVVGNSGRNNDHPVIAAQAGRYRKELVFEGVEIKNPTASLFRFNDPRAEVSVRMDGADVSVARYASALKAASELTVCGRRDQAESFHCR